MAYAGKNVVVTNPSSRNQGRPATIRVVARKDSVELCQGLKGGNEYGIALAKDGSLPDLVEELIGHCPKSALPKLLGAVGVVIASEG